MSAKHTSGPWTHEDEYQSAERKLKTGNDIVRDARGHFVCAVETHNGALIAAAPELLAALRSAENWLSEYEDGPDSRVIELLAQIRAAIVKATGEA